MINRTTFRRAGIAAAAAAAALALAACSSGGGTEAAGAEENPYNLITPGQIRVASLGDAKPYTFTDEQGEFTGFDVELFKDVADRIGVDDVVFTGQDFSGLLAAVANGQFDVGVAAIGITDERKQTVDFSEGYLAGYLTVITTKTRASPTRTTWPASASASCRARSRRHTPSRTSPRPSSCGSPTTTRRSPR